MLSASNSANSSIAKAVVFETLSDPHLQQEGKVVGQNRSQTLAKHVPLWRQKTQREETEISRFSWKSCPKRVRSELGKTDESRRQTGQQRRNVGREVREKAQAQMWIFPIPCRQGILETNLGPGAGGPFGFRQPTKFTVSARGLKEEIGAIQTSTSNRVGDS